MKNTIFLCIILLFFQLIKAQGPQQLVTVPYNTWSSAKVKGWLYLPSDYNASTTHYPVVIFYHGLGEAGTDPNKLLTNGIPKLISSGMRPDNITNPIDGKKYSFIVLSVQHWSWSPDPAWLPFQLEWLKSNYRIDTNRVYVTGMSAGGQQSLRAASNNEMISSLVAAAVPMSPANAADFNPQLIEQNNIETWFFSGNTDGNYTQNATTYSSKCNLVYPGSSKLNIYSGGHCCWNTYYNTNWNDPQTGLSVWEWMLQYTKENTKVLPVNFLSVNLKKHHTGLVITWNVSEEDNVERYVVEKSHNGSIFSNAGSVVAIKADTYNYLDLNAPSLYYRIKSVDRDGKYKYSSVIRYKEENSSVILKAFPVPAGDELFLQHASTNSSSQIIVRTIDGRQVKNHSVQPGTQQTLLDISELTTGTYIVQFKENEQDISSLMIVKK